MKFHHAISFAISLYGLLPDCPAQGSTNNQWTFVSFSKNKAYFYKGTLEEWKQVSVVNLWDSLQTKKLADQAKQNKATDTLAVILKGTSEGGFEGSVNLFNMADRLSGRWRIEPLNAKEKELFQLSDLEQGAKDPLKPAAQETASSMPGNRFTLYIRIKNDGSVWYKTDDSFNENNYTKADKQAKTAFAEFIDSYQKKCLDKKIPETIFIVGSSKSQYTDFSFVVNELEKHKIYNYNLITAPD